MILSTHFVYGYMVLYMWQRTNQIVGSNLMPPLHGLFFLISGKGAKLGVGGGRGRGGGVIGVYL